MFFTLVFTSTACTGIVSAPAAFLRRIYMKNLLFKAPHGWPLSKFTVDILFYQEADAWVALALDMDIEGRGETKKNAMSDLMDHITMQVGFAIQQKQPELIFKLADAHWWKIFHETRDRELRAAVTSGKIEEGQGYGVGSLSIPPDLLSAARKRKPFRRAYGS